MYFSSRLSLLGYLRRALLMARPIQLKGPIEGLGVLEGSERERMQRISLLLSTAFLQFRRATWHMCVRNISAAAENQQVLIIEDENKTTRWNGWWSPFPADLPDMDDARNQAAVLTTMACYDMGCMSLLATQLCHGTILIQEQRRITLLTHVQTSKSPSKT